jgi:hypothetical protein
VGGLTPEWIETFLMVINPILVWLVPGNWIWPRK